MGPQVATLPSLVFSSQPLRLRGRVFSLSDHKTGSVTMGKGEPTIKKNKACSETMGNDEPTIKKGRGVKRQMDEPALRMERGTTSQRRKELQYWSEKAVHMTSSRRI